MLITLLIMGGTSSTLGAQEAGTISLEGTLTADDAGPGDQFGRSISIDGDTMIIGAPYN